MNIMITGSLQAVGYIQRSCTQHMDWAPSHSRGGRSGGGPSRSDGPWRQDGAQGSRGPVRGNCNACGNPGNYVRDCEAVKKGLIPFPSRGGFRGSFRGRGHRGGHRGGMYTTHLEGEGEDYGYSHDYSHHNELEHAPSPYQLTHVNTTAVQASPAAQGQHF